VLQIVVEAGCSGPKKTRSVPSAGKVMASVFWDAEGILFIDYLEKGKTITGEYYSSLQHTQISSNSSTIAEDNSTVQGLPDAVVTVVLCS